jgi:hypothetical protein
MRRIALAPVGFVALVIAGSHCGGASGGLGGDASAGDGGSSGGSAGSGGSSSGSGGNASSGSGGSGGGSNSSSSSSGGNNGSDGGSSSGSSGGSASSSSSGSSGSGSGGSGSGGPIDGGGHTCVNASGCGMGQTCCGTTCCTSTQLCCTIGPVPPVDPYYCYTPTASQPTCPRNCSPKCVSDRNLKRAVEPVDDQAVLQSVARMPVSTWSYKSDDPSVRHLGPMAQDFHAAFGLGDTDRAYDSIDAHGVAFAAIKGLYEQVQEQSARVERLERENEELRTRQCVPGR